jgi:hypothetical protein
MKKTAFKLVLSFVIFVLSVPLIGFNGWFGIGIPIGLVLSILYWFDLAWKIRNAPSPTRALRIMGVLMGVPQALFGLLCVSIGLAVVIWVIYNSFVERQPQYSGGFMTLGIGPALILFGFGWLATAFRRESDESGKD